MTSPHIARSSSFSLSLSRALSTSDPVHRYWKPCGTLHYTQAAPLNRPFFPSHILAPGHLWEELAQSLSSATSAPRSSESSRLSKSRSSSHQTHSLPGDSLQSWLGKLALQFLTIECSLCCISWGPHIWPSQSEITAEERGKSHRNNAGSASRWKTTGLARLVQDTCTQQVCGNRLSC